MSRKCAVETWLLRIFGQFNPTSQVIEQQGQVSSVDAGRICVRLGPGSGCQACDAGEGCGAGLFGRLLKRRPIELEFEYAGGVSAGQAVSVAIDEAVYLRLVCRLYLWPLLGGLAVAWLSHQIAVAVEASMAKADLAALFGLMLGATAIVQWTRSAWSMSATDAVRFLGPVQNGQCGSSSTAHRGDERI